MFNICLDPRETCINKGVERSYKGHFVASLRSFCRIKSSKKNIDLNN